MAPSIATERMDSLPTEAIHRLTVAQYHGMMDAGILTASDRVELLEGCLVSKMTKNPPHRIATRRARVCLEAVVPSGWYVDTQEPIVTNDSEPEPDVSVIRGKTDDYALANPDARQVGLVVGVADGSLLRDRHLKKRIYAAAGIPSYWIINLVDRRIEVHREPQGMGVEAHYLTNTAYIAADQIELILDDQVVGTVRAAELLPAS